MQGTKGVRDSINNKHRLSTGKAIRSKWSQYRKCYLLKARL